MNEVKESEIESIEKTFNLYSRIYKETERPGDVLGIHSVLKRETPEHNTAQVAKRKKLRIRLEEFIKKVESINETLTNNNSAIGKIYKQAVDRLKIMNDKESLSDKEKALVKLLLLKMSEIKILFSKNKKLLLNINEKLVILKRMLRGTIVRINADAIDQMRIDEKTKKQRVGAKQPRRETGAKQPNKKRLREQEETINSLLKKQKEDRPSLKMYAPPVYVGDELYPHEALPANTYDSCLPTMPNITIKEHQTRVIKHILKYRGLIAVHSMGSGKTMIAATAARCVTQAMILKNKRIKVIFISPKSLTENFKKEIRFAYRNVNFTDYHFMTYDSFLTASNEGEIQCENSFLIIDEGHNLRTIIDLTKPEGKRAHAIVECAKKAFKVLILTATPVINARRDMINLMAMVRGTNPRPVGQFNVMLEDTEISRALFNDYFRCSLSFYQHPQDENFPSHEIRRVEIPMDNDFYQMYYKVQEDLKNEMFTNEETNLKAFYNGVRRASTASTEYMNLNRDPSLGNPKLKWLKDYLKNHRHEKILIFSQFVKMGVEQIQKITSNLGIKSGVITGEIEADDRTKIVKEFNRGDFRVMIISKAGGEGLDLKETNTVILMQPGWNQAEIDQATGRAIRYKSHSNLPVHMRNVVVYKLIMIKPHLDSRIDGDETDSVDEKLEALSNRKNERNNLFLDRLRMLSIENDPSSCR
jgi:Mimiviridae putative ATP-dependent RNA helicase